MTISKYNVVTFGAYSDGTYPTETTAAINACTEAAPTGSEIIFPSGTFACTTLVHPSTKLLRYKGHGGVNGGSPGTTITFTGTPGWSFPLGSNQSKFSSIENIQIQGTTTGQTGLQIANNGVALKNFRSDLFLVAIDAPSCQQVEWNSVMAFCSTAEANSISVQSLPSGTQQFNSNIITNLEMSGNLTSGTGLKLVNGGSGIYGNIFLFPIADHLQVAYSISGVWATPGGNTFIGAWSETLAGGGEVHISDAATAGTMWINRISLGTGTVSIGSISTDIPNTVTTTFLPVLAFGGLSTGITYGVQSCRWNKILNRVFFDMRITLTSKGSAVGTATLTLPIAVKTGALASAISLGYSNVLDAAAITQVKLIATAGGNVMNLYRYAAGAETAMADTDFENTTDLVISGNYEY